MKRFSEHITNEIEKIRLLNLAMKYEASEFNLFAAEIGWEDWMNDFTVADEGDEITQAEADLIDSILLGIFNEAQRIKNSN